MPISELFEKSIHQLVAIELKVSIKWKMEKLMSPLEIHDSSN